MFTKELAVPLILLIMSIGLKTCSLLVLCTAHQEESKKDSAREHEHEENSIIMATLRNKKIARSA